jgi:2-haloacid dehalogenase
MANTKIRAVFFDFMGTCLDWHSGTINVLPQTIVESERSKLALEWRHNYFDANASRLAANEPPEDIDITLRKTLDAMLEKHPAHKNLFNDQTKHRCVAAWHSMPAWPEVPKAIEQLKAAGYEVFVYANGTTRLQLDLCKSSGLSFNMLFSSELLGVYKPAPESYRKILRMVKVKPEESVMVAAHAFDVRGGKEAGMKTVYIHRWTDDIKEDMEVVEGENDFFLEDMTNLPAVIGRFSAEDRNQRLVQLDA